MITSQGGPSEEQDGSTPGIFKRQIVSQQINHQ